MTAANHGDRVGAEDFVDVVYQDVFLAVVRNVAKTLESPPGRRPAARLVAMHDWFTSLSDDDREMLREVTRYSADSAIFSLLCLLDNVMPVTDGYRQTLELIAREGEQRWPVSMPPEELHGLFRSRVDDESGWE